MKKISNLFRHTTLVLLLVLAWGVRGVLAQGPNEEIKDEVSSAQLPPPMIELAGQIGGTVNDTWWVNNVSVMGNMAYVSADDGLHLIDISTPARPTQAGFYPTMGGVGEVVLIGNIAGVLNGDFVLFINVANPAALSEVGSYPLPFSGFPDYAQDIAVVGHTAYVVRFVTGLYLLDIANPAAPILIGSYNSPDRTFGVAAAGNRAYLAGGQSGLYIADISDPTMPTGVGSHPGLMAWSNDVAAEGNRVYLADGLFGFGGLSIIDAANPRRPKLIGSIDLGDTRHVTIQGSYAYLLVEGDLHIVDISHPDNPTEIGFYDNDVTWWIDDLDAQNNYVYVAAEDKGLLVLRLLRHKITGGVSTNGGYLSSHGTYLAFPAGAFTDMVALTYRHLWQDQDMGNLVGIGHTFELEAIYHITGQPAQLAPGQTFDILVQYTDAENGPAIEDTLALYYWNGSQWVKEASSMVDPAANTVTAQPNHWATLWAVLGETRRMFLPVILDK
ncbi:MAG: hypothetical protein DPW09_17595 [Anaerolineae bacterium]|nr:hypothetical protein [Anaerolineales bacterium]MCQ3975259.1 hypothetical protein [Anaerolineae bacterium]